MLRRLLGVALVGIGTASAPAPSWGQVTTSPAVAAPSLDRVRRFYAAPGFYGTSLGTPSYGSVRTYSEFSSPFGAGYGYGYAPASFLPGPYGVGLWRPGVVSPGYYYGASYHSYRTFPAPYTPGSTVETPPFGAYAPAFGPPLYYGRGTW